mmetsp:Transcript_35318/g.59959  ORF Transcript_35318/g.59959 Transcript_35318/m.59959 type:complete len:405 (+) Transcript_35318:41-1255(+)
MPIAFLPKLLGIFLAINDSPINDPRSNNTSRWRRRTAKRRERTEQLLGRIEAGAAAPPPFYDGSAHLEGPASSCDVPTLCNPPIDWERLDGSIDPIRGGRIKPDSPRGARKRAQVEVFAHIASQLLSRSSSKRATPGSRGGTTIIDAGSGAGNLAIPLASLLHTSKEDFNEDFDVLAVDTNAIALRQLEERAGAMPVDGLMRTICADLADPETILQDIPSDWNIIVVSLHACGAASDYAMNLAYQRGAPFVICPCCTAKSLTKRDVSNDSNDGDKAARYDENVSFRRSGANDDMIYPRSSWLQDILSPNDLAQEEYSILAKVADVGLGPQTPSQQREHQRRAKRIIELDRLASGYEVHGYETGLCRIEHHNPLLYGKGELLLGAKQGSVASNVFRKLSLKWPNC